MSLVPPFQHQLLDFDVGGVGDLEDRAVAEDVAAAGGGGKLNGGVAAGVLRVEALVNLAEAVGVRRLDEEIVVAVHHAVVYGAEGVGEVQRRLDPVEVVEKADHFVDPFGPRERAGGVVLDHLLAVGMVRCRPVECRLERMVTHGAANDRLHAVLPGDAAVFELFLVEDHDEVVDGLGFAEELDGVRNHFLPEDRKVLLGRASAEPVPDAARKDDADVLRAHVPSFSSTIHVFCYGHQATRWGSQP